MTQIGAGTIKLELGPHVGTGVPKLELLTQIGVGAFKLELSELGLPSWIWVVVLIIPFFLHVPRINLNLHTRFQAPCTTSRHMKWPMCPFVITVGDSRPHSCVLLLMTQLIAPKSRTEIYLESQERSPFLHV